MTVPTGTSEEGMLLDALLGEVRALRKAVERMADDPSGLPRPASPSGPAGGGQQLSGMPTHLGGPWWQLPNGEKVRGKAEAMRRVQEGS